MVDTISRASRPSERWQRTHTLYRKPNTSKPASGHEIYPYLLRKLPVSITARRVISRLVW